MYHLGLGFQQRNSGLYVPDINFDYQFRFRADSGINLIDGRASAWQDSVSGFTLLQGLASNRPFYSANEINGKPALRFEGSQWMDAAMTAALAAIANGNNTMLVVLKELGTISCIISGAASTGGLRWGHLIESGQIAVNNNSSVNRVLSGIAPTGSRIDSRVMIRNGSNLTVNVNGVSVTEAKAANPGFTTSNIFSVGRQPAGPVFAQMAVAEIVIANHAIIVANQANWHGYVNTRYAIPII